MPMLMEDMNFEEEAVIQLIYERNDRNIDWRRDLPRMEYLRGLEDPVFLQNFRMTKPIFERLVVEFGNHLTARGRLIRLRTELDKCLLMALWVLANLDTFRATGTQFGVSRGTVHFHYLVVIEALREMAPKFIKWPSAAERRRISQRIEEKTGYPGIVGMIDGTLIKMTAPRVQRVRYIDRHQSYSLNVQAVCDDNLLFRDVYIGEPGSVHDIRVLERSPLSDILLERDDIVAEDQHIIGDGGYEVRRKILKPFTNLGGLTQAQKRFNYVHSAIRMAIERAFGRLKGKWRRLFLLYVKTFAYGMDHILSTFVLHNFILLQGLEMDGIYFNLPEQHGRVIPEPEELEDEEEDEDEDRLMNVPDDEEMNGPEYNIRPDAAHPLLAASKIAGHHKRAAIMERLFEIINGR